MARHLSPQLDTLSTICGSPGYMAPEIILQTPYDEKVRVRACLTNGSYRVLHPSTHRWPLTD